MRDVKIGTKFEYDGELCLAMYKKYKVGFITDEEITCYVKRYIIMHVQGRYRRLGPNVMEDLIQGSLLTVWTLLKKQSVPDRDVNAFHAFLNTVIHRSISKEFHAVYGPDLSSLSYEEYDSRFGRRDTSQNDIENNIFLEELPQAIRSSVAERIRFEEPEWREAALYAMDRTLAGKRVVSDLVKRKWRLNNAQIKFLRDHILVLIRDVVYSFRQYVKFSSPKEERDTLWESFEQSLWSPSYEAE